MTDKEIYAAMAEAVSIDVLKNLLPEAVNEEDYILAQALKEEITKRRFISDWLDKNGYPKIQKKVESDFYRIKNCHCSNDEMRHDCLTKCNYEE